MNLESERFFTKPYYSQWLTWIISRATDNEAAKSLDLWIHLENQAIEELITNFRRDSGQDILRVLDIGCGFGRHLLQLLRADPHISGAGVDISMPSIAAATAEARLYGMDGRATFIVGDASDLKTLELGKFDIAICMANTLGNMPTAKQRRLIRTVSTVLKPSGLILFSVYSVASIASRLESYRAVGLSVRQRGTQIVAEEGLVSYSFSSSELRSLINASGLSMVGEVTALSELGWQVVARRHI